MDNFSDKRLFGFSDTQIFPHEQGALIRNKVKERLIKGESSYKLLMRLMNYFDGRKIVGEYIPHHILISDTFNSLLNCLVIDGFIAVVDEPIEDLYELIDPMVCQMLLRKSSKPSRLLKEFVSNNFVCHGSGVSFYNLIHKLFLFGVRSVYLLHKNVQVDFLTKKFPLINFSIFDKNQSGLLFLTSPPKIESSSLVKLDSVFLSCVQDRELIGNFCQTDTLNSFYQCDEAPIAAPASAILWQAVLSSLILSKENVMRKRFVVNQETLRLGVIDV